MNKRKNIFGSKKKNKGVFGLTGLDNQSNFNDVESIQRSSQLSSNSKKLLTDRNGDIS